MAIDVEKIQFTSRTLTVREALLVGDIMAAKDGQLDLMSIVVLMSLRTDGQVNIEEFLDLSMTELEILVARFVQTFERVQATTKLSRSMAGLKI